MHGVDIEAMSKREGDRIIIEGSISWRIMGVWVRHAQCPVRGQLVSQMYEELVEVKVPQNGNLKRKRKIVTNNLDSVKEDDKLRAYTIYLS